MALKVEDKIPEILGYDQTGKELKREDFKGKKLVLYFYPKDNTPGCTAEACSLRDAYSELQKAGYEIIGVRELFISCENVESSCKSFIVGSSCN